MGRKNHAWSTELPGSERAYECMHCSLVTRHGWYEYEGHVRDVIQWWTPAGALLRIRPTHGFKWSAA